MNERIKTLMPKPWTFPYPDREMYSKEQLERFAELIVEECMWITVKQTHIPSNYRKDVNTMIKQHFGVE